MVCSAVPLSPKHRGVLGATKIRVLTLLAGRPMHLANGRFSSPVFPIFFDSAGSLTIRFLV